MVKAPSSTSPRARGRSCEKAIFRVPRGTWDRTEGASKLVGNRDLRQAPSLPFAPWLALVDAETRRNGEAQKRHGEMMGTVLVNCRVLRVGVRFTRFHLPNDV